MADMDAGADKPTLNRVHMTVLALNAAALLLVIAIIAWAALGYWEMSQQAVPPRSQVLSTTVILLAGCGAALLLRAVAEILRKVDLYVEAGLHAQPSQSASPESVERAAAAAEVRGRSWDELAGLLRELRDITLLTEEQRAHWHEAQARETARRLEQEVPALLQEHKWVEAKERVAAARSRFPTVAIWDQLDARIAQVRESLESRDVETAARQVNDLAGLGAWDRAAEVVHDLVNRHPDSAKAREIARRVARERGAAEAEQRARLMSQAQQASNNRDWTTALKLVQTLLERYPDSPEANDLRVQFPTVRANAEIQTRQRMESEFRELLKQRRYPKALELAREIIGRYPGSPQATVLLEQLPKLEERARQG